MSERGVFAVDRGVWDHDLLVDNSPFSRREAWLWLVSEAAWKPHRRRILGRPIDLARGQLVASLRFLAERWRWSEPRVRRFLSALKTDAMIDAMIDAGLTVITICKYDEYQRVSLPSDAMRSAQTGAGATQERRKVEDKEDKEVRAAPPAPLIAQPAEDAELYARGRAVLGKNSGGLVAKLLKAKNGNIALARAAIEQASTKSDPKEYIGAILRAPNGTAGKIDLSNPDDVMRFALS